MSSLEEQFKKPLLGSEKRLPIIKYDPKTQKYFIATTTIAKILEELTSGKGYEVGTEKENAEKVLESVSEKEKSPLNPYNFFRPTRKTEYTGCI